MILHVCVANKIASFQKRDGCIVCGNSDYQIKFTFDSEWDAYTTKTARFIWNGEFTDVDFSGDTCDVPIIHNTSEVKVGVYAGELHTTTSAVIGCHLSVLCDTVTPSVENDRNYANESKAHADRAESAADRAGKDATEAATAEVTRLVGELGIVQNMGDSTVAVMSQKATSAELRRNDKRITNLEQGLPEDNFMVDETLAYMKDVPANALPFAEVQKVGGMTYKSKNLISHRTDSYSSNGVKFTVQDDGGLYLYGTATGQASFYIVPEESALRTPIKAGTYTMSLSCNTTSNANIEFIVGVSQDAEYRVTAGTVRNIEIQNDTTFYARIRVLEGVVANGTFYPMLNEGATALPFEHPYKVLRETKVTEVTSTGVNILNPDFILSSTQSGVTFTKNADGSITANGTATSDIFFEIVRVADQRYLPLKNKDDQML